MSPTRFSRILAATIFTASFSTASSFSTMARAAESTRGPAYVEAHLAGVALGFTTVESTLPGMPSASTTTTAWPLELHGGYHVTGRHDGFVVGATQKVLFGGGTAGATLARLGYDIAVPIGPRELTVAPFAFGGIFYASGQTAAYLGGGAEVRFFPIARDPGGDAGGPRRVVVKADRIEIKEKIQFRASDAVIEEVSYSLLDEIAAVIKRNPQLERIRIEGHASAEGDPARNTKLSDDRARAVREYLVLRGGVSPDLLEAHGYGSSRPLAGNDTDDGREINRRVEFNIVKQAATATVQRVEPRSGDGLFVVVRPLELGVVTATPSITVLSVQAGVGYAF